MPNHLCPIMKATLPALLLLILLSACSSGAPDGYIVTDAVVYTVNEAQPMAEAFAVIDGRIGAVGTADEVRTAHPGLEERSAGGRTIVPGFIDAHGHFMGLGTQRLQVDLRGTRSLDEAIERLKTYEASLPDSAWITGRGWNQELWPTRAFPTAADLDVHFPDRPVWLSRIDGHAAWANTAAMDAAGLDRIRSMEDPDGGAIIRDADGEPTGIFVDAAEGIINAVVPDLTEEQLDRALELALDESAQVGLTGVHDAGVNMATINRYQRFIDEGRFPMRLYAMIGGTGTTFDALCNNHIIDYGERLSVQSVKLYLDGALGSRGAALIEDYSDDPGNRGLLFSEPEEFAAVVQRAVDCGYQVNTHAIGDRGNQVLLDSYEAAGVSPEGRHRDEHTQIIELDEIERFKRLGIIASMQPTHATSDLNMAEDRLGPHRIKGGYAWKSLLDAGVPLALGSDFPVEKSDPLLGFFAAVTRQTEDLFPEGGWYPEERLSREETLYGFTKGAAYAAFKEDVSGSIETGKHADFVVLSEDIMQVAAPRILETEVVATVFAGEEVHGSIGGE